MTGYTRDVGSLSTSTGISPHLSSRRSPTESSGAPRKRTWGVGGSQQSQSESNTTRSYNNSASRTPDLVLEASLGNLSLSQTPQSLEDLTCAQLHGCIQRLKYITTNKYIPADTAFKEYSVIRDTAKALCVALLHLRQSSQPSSSPSPVNSPPSSSDIGLSLASGLSGLSLGTTANSQTGAAGDWHRPPNIYNQRLDLVRTWTNSLGDLLVLLKSLISDSYRSFDATASPAMVEQLFRDKVFRNNVTLRMRSVSVADTKVVNARFREFDSVSADLHAMRHLLHNAESGISPDRIVEDIVISQRGDAVLEFANKDSDEFPVFRFRVSSYMLAETSPLFAQIFGAPDMLPIVSDVDGNVAQNLPPTPTNFVCADGSEVKLFRMPQLELNVGKSLEILLHAAHLHNNEVPREIDFDTFVAVAEVCMRYQCTAPLELTVEYLWLPQWIHKAAEDISDGLLLVSYAFGLRGLFSRVSKTAILKIVDQSDLESRPFPSRVKEKIWAMRTAKIDQVHHSCNSLLQEYLRCPPPGVNKNESVVLMPSAKPHCSKGSHACDALSLGWLMMAFNELEVLPQIMYTSSLGQRPPLPRRSLEQLIGNLRCIGSPSVSHSGPCDFVSTFKAALNDISNSIRGLTLYDVSGQHGWALSKHEDAPRESTIKSVEQKPNDGASERGIADVALGVLTQLDTLEDVYNTALANKTFFRAFKDNEVTILRGLIVKSGQPERWTLDGAGNKEEARAELALLRDGNRIGQSRRHSQVTVSEDPHQACDANSETTGNFSQFTPVDDSSDGESLVETIGAGQASFEAKMTREEAERILWPDTDPTEPSQTGGRLTPFSQDSDLGTLCDGMRESTEKFLAGDVLLEYPEHKSLVTEEDKNLSGEHYRRIGLERTDMGTSIDHAFIGF